MCDFIELLKATEKLLKTAGSNLEVIEAQKEGRDIRRMVRAIKRLHAARAKLSISKTCVLSALLDLSVMIGKREYSQVGEWKETFQIYPKCGIRAENEIRLLSLMVTGFTYKAAAFVSMGERLPVEQYGKFDFYALCPAIIGEALAYLEQLPESEKAHAASVGKMLAGIRESLEEIQAVPA